MALRTAAAVVLTLVSCVFARAEDASNEKALELFEQRIMPIFKSAKPSSCVQCHLSSVDLKDYILPSQEATFASLNAQGLVNLKHPEKSKILDLIAMGNRDKDEKAKRIHADMRQAEYEAFAAWIKACCNNSRLRKLTVSETVAKPERPNEVIRHARKSRVVDSFVRKIWSQRMRCFPCHTPHELDENNPKHRVPIKKVAEFEAKYGKEYAQRLRIFRETPEATLQYLIEDSKNTDDSRLPLLNLAEPQKSLLLLKPISKLPPRKANKQFEKPTYLEPISHMGGLKLHVDDPGYKAFVSFIQDYAKVVGGKYLDVASLPADNWAPTTQFLMISEAPKAWTPDRPVQMLIHAWDAKAENWSEAPVAFTQNKTTPRGRIVAPLVLLRGDGSEKFFSLEDPKQPKLKPGKYLIKTYVDRQGKLKVDPAAMLGPKEYFGQIVVDAAWRVGFPKREQINGSGIVSQSGAE